jgi:hypothetical protein
VMPVWSWLCTKVWREVFRFWKWTNGWVFDLILPPSLWTSARQLCLVLLYLFFSCLLNTADVVWELAFPNKAGSFFLACFPTNVFFQTKFLLQKNSPLSYPA